jgi:hypothetical protein
VLWVSVLNIKRILCCPYCNLEQFKNRYWGNAVGFEIDAIVGMDILEQAKVIINFYEKSLTPMI